ncbi:tRNA (adenosine(37)-N6)-dimethylallyltransferase MiaA [Rhodospirillum centenum]|uniref:tRNA dimethylallyltransferase n=1 Tax=Rhodospirillum centenum (strain ATCC 51521 / SW) TaxID=414684 RepID=MIAA_RHOCS|nr:tRNA (adenosine(37)-N6)-dimethylallyltransferase MiaA [Rhodospirillum centenum]B6ITS0.1 RecName: Full=tRNA dimethylallyltransferase; AltName: Full=Dimethylallyl diphosphate:tRNA dimethylallyltransferase; Short=DMAPP:tRNA dimethylallyltransferase; Short=DMATase; AltName: Full=Isopentenyl-diphosphate:tRNA isopentenyltransferase; Short=IPP transferase; Short=IPPT; Short=IPTase [Rhodospirillum centenum SW]ACI99371.1 tRNA delta(2)-isopentenylpyrophosphate transferase [Rhodospirillum centenum SW]
MPATRPVLLIGGPTAGGKSALALDLAGRLSGTVVNADSMQLYDGLRVLTARPSVAEEARVPHRLYGIVPPSERMSAARWRDLALAEIAAAHDAGRVPVVVGGTGLYLRALAEGLADIPPVPEPVRAEAQALHRALGTPALHARLAAEDPDGAARLHPGDTTRVLRAWEVLRATGRPLGYWQTAGRAAPPPGLRFLTLVCEPPRDRLYAACDARFLRMLEAGALEEVRRLAALGLDPGLPAMKALGVPELLAHLRGDLPLEAATATAQQATRNYAKRQLTWFRHQIAAARRFDPGDCVERNAVMKFCVDNVTQIS